MEIKELIPQAKEVLVQTKNQDGIFYDAFSYTIGSENNKSYLYIISQVQSKDPSLDYVPNLIATFVKRELELASGFNEDLLFENSLKKTNELIDGLVASASDLKIDLGVVFINKEKIAVSKIGKAKMLVFRPQKNDIFDVFENITQFRKSHLTNKRFLNIISGEIKKGDRFFFFIPTSRLNLKQKVITAALCKNEKDSFLENIQKIISPPHSKLSGGGSPPVSPIPCSGIYFEIKEEVKKIEPEKSVKEPASPNSQKATQITATEVSKINRGDLLKKTAEKFKGMILGEDSNERNWGFLRKSGINNYFVVIVIALVFIAGLIILTRGGSRFKQDLATINEKLKISESKFLLKQNYEARTILSEAFGQLNLLKEDKGKNELFFTATNLLNRIEKVDPTVRPNILYENTDLSTTKNIIFGKGKLFVNDSEKIYEIAAGPLNLVEESPINLIWIKDNKIITYHNTVKIIDLEEKRIKELGKKFNFEPVEMKNYEDNLYFLGSKNIYKISNALVSPIEEFEWLKDAEASKIPGNFVDFDLDSSIYVLTDERKLATLFKGELVRMADLDFEIRQGLKLATLGNPEKSPEGDHGASNEFMVVDKEMKLARVIDAAGEVKVSYDLSDIDVVKDVFFDKESQTLYLLSPTKIWQLKVR